MKLAWATDIHIDCCRTDWLEELYGEVLEAQPDALLITGDITQAPHLGWTLGRLENLFRLPVYFVLGNHDYYGSSIVKVRRSMSRFSRQFPLLHWLDREGIVPLTGETCLMGREGWYDGRNGDIRNSNVDGYLTDFSAILELSRARRVERERILNRLGDRDAACFRRWLPLALDRFRHVVVATHVPPFAVASRYQGEMSAPDYLPFFSCRVVGEVLADAMARHTDRRMTVLCGHTHEKYELDILPNLTVRVGGAEYGYPRLAAVLALT